MSLAYRPDVNAAFVRVIRARATDKGSVIIIGKADGEVCLMHPQNWSVR